jgi:uncharacterized membrane protein YhhN
VALMAFALALAFAAVDWVAVARRQKTLEYVAKPATMVILLAGTFALMQGPHDAYHAWCFVAGLALSLVGDVFLMLPDDGTFVFGLAAFLLAQVAYAAGLTPTPPPLLALAVLVITATVGLLLFRTLATGLRHSGHTALLVPVSLYAAVLCLMLTAAWATLFRPEWTPVRRLLVVIGASLFFASDAMLAWDRFVKRSRPLHVAVIITYHLGQLGLAASVALAG